MRQSIPIQLSIPTPCSQSWEEMSLNEKGRFCGNCNKSVIDFTQYSDQQLIDFLNKSSGEVCGKLKPDQLGKPLHEIHQSNNRSFSQLLITAALVVGFGNSVYAKEKQGEVKIVQAPVSEKKPEQKKNPISGGDSIHSIVGTITDERSKETIPGATILIEGTTIATSTDMNGYFRIDVSAYLKKKEIKLKISAIGYESKTLEFKQQDLVSNPLIELKVDTSLTLAIMGGLSYQKATLWQRTKYFFRNMFR